MVYATLPRPTYNKNNGGSFPEMFPFADDERFFDGGMPARLNYGASCGHGGLLARRADRRLCAAWVNTSIPRRRRTSPPSTVAVPSSTSPRCRSTISPPGPGFFYGRNQWGPQSTVFCLQLGVTDDEGHPHNDVGSWQIWRSGRWLSRETTGYSQNIAAIGGQSVDTNNAAAHNTLLSAAAGPRRIGGRTIDGARASRVSRPIVRQRRPHPLYRSTTPQMDNPHAAHVEREFLFVRPLETLGRFRPDRKHDPYAAKTFLAHFENSPTVDPPTGPSPP